MRLAKAVLIFGAVVFLTFGVGYVIWPVQWASVTDIVLPTPLARTDFRATNGGFEIGTALFLRACAARTEWLRPGLVASALVFGGFAAARLVGILVEGVAGPLMLGVLIVEGSIVLVTLHALRRLSPA